MSDWVWSMLGKVFAGGVLLFLVVLLFWHLGWNIPAQEQRSTAMLQISAIERRLQATREFTVAQRANDTTAMNNIQADYANWFDALQVLVGGD